jgi:hypothetical protein
MAKSSSLGESQYPLAREKPGKGGPGIFDSGISGMNIRNLCPWHESLKSMVYDLISGLAR